MDADLLAAVREERDKKRALAKKARLAADEAEDEYRRADEAVVTLERIKHDLDEFNEAAMPLLDS